MTWQRPSHACRRFTAMAHFSHLIAGMSTLEPTVNRSLLRLSLPLLAIGLSALALGCSKREQAAQPAIEARAQLQQALARFHAKDTALDAAAARESLRGALTRHQTPSVAPAEARNALTASLNRYHASEAKLAAASETPHAARATLVAALERHHAAADSRAELTHSRRILKQALSRYQATEANTVARPAKGQKAAARIPSQQL